jgi:DNA-binding LytR/AlgR family response regulator
MEKSMYRIAICDDEPQILKDLSDIIMTVLHKLNVDAEYYVTQEAGQLLEYMNRTNVDILFIDIDMPGYNGMQIAEYLLNHDYKGLLIFVTNHDELVYQSFKYHPFGFIRKSYFTQEIEQVILSALKVLFSRQDSISIKINGDMIIIKLSDIMYFEAQLNYVNIFTTNEVYHYRESLGALENQLAIKGFIRIHKGFLVNQQFVHAIRYDEVELSSGKLLPVGRTNRDNVRKMLMKYMR